MLASIARTQTFGSAIAGLTCDRMRVAAEMLIAGVAFQTDGKTWEVFSHNGEHIGTLSTYMVTTTARALKGFGMRSRMITAPAKGEQSSMTFGFDCRIPADEMEQIIARRERKFSTIH